MAAPDDYGDVAECRPVTFLDGCIECVAVEMRDSEIVQFTVPQETRGPAGRAGPGGGCLIVEGRDQWPPSELRECLRTIRAADPRLEPDRRFRRLRDYLRKSGIELD